MYQYGNSGRQRVKTEKQDTDSQTDRETCRNRTAVHMAAPKIQSCSMVAVNVNGIQKTAMVRSATARLTRNARRSVRDRCPAASTTMTMTLPETASSVVDVYRAINTYWCSSGRPGSCRSAVVFDVLTGVVPLTDHGMMMTPHSATVQTQLSVRDQYPVAYQSCYLLFHAQLRHAVNNQQCIVYNTLYSLYTSVP